MERPHPRQEFTPTPEQRTRMTEAMGKLEQSLDHIYDDETFRSWLDVQSRFHTYSATNTAMILAQRPDATKVMGLRQWNQLQRFVNKGERGLDIFAPIFPKGLPKDEQKQANPVAYIPVKVFAYEQTNGKPLPEFDVPVLEGDEGGQLYSSLGALANLEGVQVHEIPNFADGSMGFYSPSHKLIGIRTHHDDGTEIAQLQRTKTMAHEVAHHFDLSDRAKSPEAPRRDHAETEGIAEASAYVVLSHFGLDSGLRSFPYIARWTENKRVLKNIMGEIQRVSGKIIRGCEDMLGMDLLPGHTGSLPTPDGAVAGRAAAGDDTLREDVLRPYRVIHSNVDGAGFVGEYDTLEQATAEADRLHAKAVEADDTLGFHFYVFDSRADNRHQTP